MHTVKRYALVAAIVAFCAGPPVEAPAQGFPQKPVSIIAPVAAGVGADVIARILAERLSQRWSQQVVIVNRPGGSGAIAAQAAAIAPPDGHTLYMAVSSGFAVIPETKSKWPVDLATDFTTIGLISEQPMIIAATPSLGVNTLAEFIDYVKQRPGDVLYGASRLSVPHLTGELLNERAGIKMRYIPTVGAAKVMQDILNGNLHAVTDSVPGIRGAIQNGTVKALAFTGDKRLASYPDLPLASETLPDFHVKGWFVLMGPANMPEAVVSQIRRDLREILQDPELRRRYEASGTFPRPATIEQTLAYIKAEQDLWRPIVRQVGTE